MHTIECSDCEDGERSSGEVDVLAVRFLLHSSGWCFDEADARFSLDLIDTNVVSPLLQIILHGQNTCCDSNRSIHEGVSSHSVCPCQLERVLNRVPSVPVSLLPRPTFNDGTFSIGTDLSAFYSPLVSPVREVCHLLAYCLSRFHSPDRSCRGL